MITVSVRSNHDKITLELLNAAEEMKPATVRALNKTADQVKVQGAREVRAAGYGLKAADVKAALRVMKASLGNLRATVVASGRPIPLIKYGARQTAKGVTVNVKNGRKLIAGAFIATMRTGHVGVFVRQDGSKHRKVNKTLGGWHELPIRELFGPGIPDGMANEAVQSALQALITDRFPQILEHEHAWLSKKLKH